jgi:peptidoglycan/LPS O-acetylase OafA/YrhL
LSVYPTNTVAPYVLFPCRMDALFLGVLTAIIYRNKRAMLYLKRYRPVLVVAFVVSLVAILAGSHHLGTGAYFTQTIGYSLMAVFYTLGLIIALTAKASPTWLTAGRRPLVWAGIGAYSIYLFHRPIQGVIEGYLGYNTLEGRLASLAVVLLAAVVCWRLIERPAITAGRRSLQYRPHVASAAKSKKSRGLWAFRGLLAARPFSRSVSIPTVERD